jgi:hypothetical protein
MNKITYHKEGDYLIPDLTIKNDNKNYHIGKYGNLRLSFLKEHKKGLYTELMMNGELRNHLVDIDMATTKRIRTIIEQFTKSENIDENLKQTNQMEWVQAMNNIKNRAEEIVLNEIIYV